MSRGNETKEPALHAEALLHRAFLASADAMILSNAARRIVSGNDAASTMFGYTASEMIGLPVRSLYGAEEDWARVRLARRLPDLPTLATLRHKSGALFDASVTVAAIRGDGGSFVGVIETVRPGFSAPNSEPAAAASAATDRTLRLARGIAHDFNNLLAIIGGNIQLAAARTRPQSVLGFLNEAEQACQMGARLTQRLKAFAQDRQFQCAEFDVTEMLMAQRPLLARALGGAIALDFQFAAESARVRADVSAFENAVLNLAMNARDAMPNGGTAVLSVANVHITDATSRPTNLRAGEYLCVAVSDTGTGMSPHVRARAFDPFFTTKHPDRGSGLGLSSVYGFAHQSGGTAVIENTTRTGSTVSIYLPALGSTGP